MIRIAVLGCGRIGAMHAANIAAHPRAALPACRTFMHLPPLPSLGGNRRARLPSAEAVFASAEVDAVLIATATDTHADLLEMAVASGKQVLCEKPVDLSLERVNRCAATIAGTTVPVQLGFVRRFDPGHARCVAPSRRGDR